MRRVPVAAAAAADRRPEKMSFAAADGNTRRGMDGLIAHRKGRWPDILTQVDYLPSGDKQR